MMKLKARVACGVAAAALAAAVAPAAAMASTAETDVVLKVDETQLSVTAPLQIPLTMLAGGSFAAPDPSSAKIVNESVVRVAVKSYTVEANSQTNAVNESAFDDAVEPNTWWASVSPNAGKTYSFSESQPSLGSAWNMSAAGGGSDEIELTLDGAMKNATGTVDWSTQTKLADVTWTFGASQNMPD